MALERVYEGGRWQTTVDPGGGSQTSVAQATLTAAQIIDLVATPAELAAAPGAGKAYMVLRVQTQALPGTTPFAIPKNARLEVGSTAQVLQDYSTWETARFDQGGSHTTDEVLNGSGSQDGAILTQSQEPAIAAVFPSTLVDNQPLAVGNPGHDFDGGVILAATVADAGSGYAPGDQFSIIEAGPFDGVPAVGEVDTVDGGGGVLTFHLVSGGDPGAPYFVGYANPYVTEKTGGGGDDLLTITVTDSEQGDGELRVAVAYAIIDVT